MQIKPNEIHIWTADLETASFQENIPSMLSEDERERAFRFQFPIHRQRFIAGRCLLRTIISLYTQVPPPQIIFSYEDKKKPSLKFPSPSSLQFNVSHSGQMAVYAFTLNHAIGVDIEKVQTDYHQGVAHRFFSPQENHALLQAPLHKRPTLFYRIWARKEAIVKAIGKGLSMHLPSFSVSVNNDFEVVMIDNGNWFLLPLTMHQAYQSAVATNQRVKKVSYWKFIDQIPALDKVEDF